MIIFGGDFTRAGGSGGRRWPVLGVSSVFLLLTLTRSAILATVVGIIVVAPCAAAECDHRRVRGERAARGGPGSRSHGAVRDPDLRGTGCGQAGDRQQSVWRINYWTKVLPLANQEPRDRHRPQHDAVPDVLAAKQPHNDFIRARGPHRDRAGSVWRPASWSTSSCCATRSWRCCALGARHYRERRGSRGAGLRRGVPHRQPGLNMMSNVVSLWYLVAFSAAAAYVARSRAADPFGRWNLR